MKIDKKGKNRHFYLENRRKFNNSNKGKKSL